MSQPVIEAGALRLRPFGPGDSALVRSVTSDPLIPLITTVPTSTDEAELRAYIDRQNDRLTSGTGCSFAIARADDDAALGHIGLTFRGDERASVGYWIGPEHRGHGLAGHALRALAHWALTQPEVARLELYVEPWNIASIRTAETAGFEREGLLRAWQVVGDSRRDMWMYARLAGGGDGAPAPA